MEVVGIPVLKAWEAEVDIIPVRNSLELPDAEKVPVSAENVLELPAPEIGGAVPVTLSNGEVVDISVPEMCSLVTVEVSAWEGNEVPVPETG